jgi:hypothetical protein
MIRLTCANYAGSSPVHVPAADGGASGAQELSWRGKAQGRDCRSVPAAGPAARRGSRGISTLLKMSCGVGEAGAVGRRDLRGRRADQFRAAELAELRRDNRRPRRILSLAIFVVHSGDGMRPSGGGDDARRGLYNSPGDHSGRARRAFGAALPDCATENLACSVHLED